LPDEYHGYQPLLLRHTFKPANYDPEEIFIGADINLYYDLHHLNWYKRPDWFAVIGVSRLYEGCDRAPKFEQPEVIALHILAFRGQMSHLGGSDRLILLNDN